MEVAKVAKWNKNDAELMKLVISGEKHGFMNMASKLRLNHPSGGTLDQYAQ